MEKWEYKFVKTNYYFNEDTLSSGPDREKDLLLFNELGNDGWELVWFVDTYTALFKRRK